MLQKADADEPTRGGGADSVDHGVPEGALGLHGVLGDAEEKAAVDCTTKCGRTPLKIASEHNHLACVEYLVAQNVVGGDSSPSPTPSAASHP